MKKTLSLGTLGIAAFLGTAIVGATPAFAAGYTLTSLGLGNQAFAINNAGQMTGIGWKPGAIAFAAVFDNGVTTNLSGSVFGQGSAINDHGQAVGRIDVAQYSGQAFIYSDGVVQKILPLGGPKSTAFDINNAGQVVGAAMNSDGVNHGFIYKDGVTTDLGSMGGNASVAAAINNNGQVTGYVKGPYYNRSFLYDNGAITFLSETLATEAADINDSGQIVGQISGGTAFLYSGGTLTNLGAFWAGGYSYASAINNKGQVVGSASVSQNVAHAFLYADGKMVDLNDFLPADSGWTLDRASGINDRGQIVGEGEYNGMSYGFVLTPVPLPPAAWLFGSGLLGLSGLARRFKSA